jgi:hypothetical protein
MSAGDQRQKRWALAPRVRVLEKFSLDAKANAIAAVYRTVV